MLYIGLEGWVKAAVKKELCILHMQIHDNEQKGDEAV